MINISLRKARQRLRRGRPYSFVVPLHAQRGHLEDLIRELWKHDIQVVGYDFSPHRSGWLIELQGAGEPMVEAELDHVDLRLLGLGEGFDHPFADQIDDESDPEFRVGHTSTEGDVELAQLIFSWIEALVPKRNSEEELGDALEQIHKAVIRGQSVWWIRLKIVSTIGWAMVNAILRR